ncbi:hypothetical protein AGATL06_18050 [Agathobaculum sp. TL06]
MAIVRTYHFDHATVHIADDCYRAAPPEEIQKRVQRMLDIAGGVLYKNELREKLEAEKRD